MIRTAKIVLLVGVAAIAGLVIWVTVTVRRGFSALDQPSAMETFVARRLRSVAIPRASKDMPNPVPAGKDVLSEAMAHFADHCAFCHGIDGSGDTAIGKGLYPKPADMRLAATQDLTDGELFYIIHNGIRMTGMPAFGGAASADQDLDSWKLVHFIRHLPRITAEELEEMKNMAPRSPSEFKEEEAIRKFLEGDDTPLPPAHKH